MLGIKKNTNHKWFGRVGVAQESDKENESLQQTYRREMLRQLVREAISQVYRFGGDAVLSPVIQPGMSVLIKPNWVVDRNFGGGGRDCLITHEAFILTVLEEVAKTRPGRVVLGDAPIQDTVFENLFSKEFREGAESLAKAHNIRLDIMDFRRTKLVNGSIWNGAKNNIKSLDQYILFDLGKDSLLEPISGSDPRFRITKYNPDDLATRHKQGRHQYLLCREAFEADITLSLPKLKTHMKVGLTAALKNLVGLNGNKEYLPHHRVGGAEEGGDCYPGKHFGKRIAERCLDAANRRIGKTSFGRWRRFADFVLNKTTVPSDRNLEGGWHGNDTCWRMVLDLNRILLYGRSDGTMSDVPQRKLLSLTDAIICGEGEGPLSPQPVRVGAVTFSESAAAADVIHAALFRFDPMKIRLIKNAIDQFRWPLLEADSSVEAWYQGNAAKWEDIVEELGVPVQAPSGWRGHVEWNTRKSESVT